MNVSQQPFSGRVEDPELLTGQGRYVGDIRLPGLTVAAFVRSPHANARIRSVEVAAARRAPGVLAVLTGADMEAAGVRDISRPMPQKGRGGAPMATPPRPSLAHTHVRHVGDPVALVVAETQAQALDAAELISVEYEELPAVTDAREAVKPNAPQVWPEAPGNIALDWEAPADDRQTNAREVDAMFSGAAHVARVSLVNQRVIVASMEGRAALAEYDAAGDLLTLHVGSQGVSTLRDHTAAILGIDRERVRVITGDVGGGFGMKSPVYPEYPAILVAARQLRRPVRWLSTRAEAFLSDNQARDTFMDMELALDREGRFLALRVNAIANLGAYHSPNGVFIATSNFARCLPCVYHIPKIAVRMRCVFTHTVPVGPYRGAGRPEANYALERLVDAAARVTGIDRATLRRRNFITPAMLPYATPLGASFDSGDFAGLLDKALALADAPRFAERRARSKASGKLRGLGISCFLEHAGGQPNEAAAIRFPGDGTIAVVLGAQSSGQGHRTVFRRLAAERLGMPEGRIVVRQGDTQLGVPGSGTVASRGTMTSGTAVFRAVETVIEKARPVAAEMLEAAASDIVYANGHFEIAGTDRRVSLLDVAAKAKLDTQTAIEVAHSFPNGCHIAEVEIDPETGVVMLESYAAVDDCGRVLDHTLAEGQIHGGVAQGVGQALIEDTVYDATGQLLTGTFMDYAMPRADQFPDMLTQSAPTLCKTNPLGVKGTGEAGTTGALAAVMNAIADAIPGEAGATLDMPATPLRVWQACQQLKKTGGH
ncbi:MAG TPA: xanthine dehydrogenase family protein molybdopterin-binding subunit [Stellaceae bacterium]|nr:xanthine dehydrogenase family protein molybdopterin-binding subunit [Stellaceae bacterium]